MSTPLSKKYVPKRSFEGHLDTLLLIVVAVLVFFGLLFLASASSIFSYKKFGSAYHMVFRQILSGVLPGAALMYIFSKIDYRRYGKYPHFFFFLSVILLLLVFFPPFAASYGTSQSWVNIFGFSFQPSELVKITFLIFLAGWIQKKGYSSVADLRYGLLPFVMYLGIISFLLVEQPDFGMLLVISLMACIVFFASGARISHFAILGAAGVLLFIIMLSSRPYIVNRFRVFFDPSQDTQNIGYQVSQAFLAIGSGGWFGKGFGKSAQKFSYLPEVSSDSIFAVIAEEMGFFVVLALIFLYLLLAYRGLFISEKAPDPYGRFLAIGIVAWITLQAFLNIAVMVGLAPLTGVTLPFISAGGTSLVTSLAGIGILLNISKHRID